MQLWYMNKLPMPTCKKKYFVFFMYKMRCILLWYSISCEQQMKYKNKLFLTLITGTLVNPKYIHNGTTFSLSLIACFKQGNMSFRFFIHFSQNIKKLLKYWCWRDHTNILGKFLLTYAETNIMSKLTIKHTLGINLNNDF